MQILLIIFIAIVTIGVLSELSLRRDIKKAETLEKNGKYREACYEYAAILFTMCGNGGEKGNEFGGRIQKILKEKGPFDFENISKKYTAHKAIVSIINCYID